MLDPKSSSEAAHPAVSCGGRSLQHEPDRGNYGGDSPKYTDRDLARQWKAGNPLPRYRRCFNYPDARCGPADRRAALSHRIPKADGRVWRRHLEVELRSFSVGGPAIPWRRILVSSINTPSIFLGPLDGVLGADVLSNFDADLDLPHHRLVLYKRQSSPSAAPAWSGSWATIAAGRSRSDHLFFPVYNSTAARSEHCSIIDRE